MEDARMEEAHRAAAEARLARAIAGMLGRADFMLPLAAAERQFRDHYYGLNSAALLEDLFFDALGNFLRQTQPTVKIKRPAPGQKGWDYDFDGLHVSHKVSQKLDVIAALWDATKTGVTRWSFADPIVYVLGSNNPRTHLMVDVPDVGQLRCRAVTDLPRPERLGGRTILFLWWPGGSQAPRLLSVHTGEGEARLTDEYPFAKVWEELAPHLDEGSPANEFELLVTDRPLNSEARQALDGVDLPTLVDISLAYRAGVYVLPTDLLQDLAVTTNNRAILIPRATIQDLLMKARDAGLFVSMSQWYGAYAQERPPDLYSAQRSEFDALFSARGRGGL